MKFKQKSTEIEAFKWTGDQNQTEDPEWIVERIRSGEVSFINQSTEDCFMVITKDIHGDKYGTIVNRGDYVILKDGELFSLDEENFNKIYEPISNNKENKNIYLYVHGDDFSATTFSENYNINEFYRDMVNEGVTERIIDTDEDYIEVYIKEFGDVDSNFESFVRDNLCDYDQLKSCDMLKVDL